MSRRKRLTLGHLMLVTGVIALVFALTRVDTAPAVSLCVFAACTWYLASRRFAETMERRAAEGLTTSRAQRARILAGSASLAVVAIGLPDGAFLAGYYGYMAAIRAVSLMPPWILQPTPPGVPYPVIRSTAAMSQWTPHTDPRHVLAGALVGIIFALYVASLMRRWLGPIVGKKPATVAAAAPVRESLRFRHQPEAVETVG